MSHSSALARAVQRGEWERVGLCLLLGLSLAARKVPPATIDNLIELLAAEDTRDDAKPARRR